jgi:Ca2+-binding RTX toxin-like protein
VSYASSSGKVNVNLGKDKQKGGDANGDKLFDIENVIGSNKGDKIVGDNGANALDGGGGNDALHGKGGDDFLTGGKGKDTFYFKSGWDADTILDFESRDTIDISVKGVETFKALKDLMTETDGNVVIDFGKGDVLTIVDTTIDALHRSDFHL